MSLINSQNNSQWNVEDSLSLTSSKSSDCGFFLIKFSCSRRVIETEPWFFQMSSFYVLNSSWVIVMTEMFSCEKKKMVFAEFCIIKYILNML